MSLCKYATFSTVKDPAARRDGGDAIRAFERSCQTVKIDALEKKPDTKCRIPGEMTYKWAIT